MLKVKIDDIPIGTEIDIDIFHPITGALLVPKYAKMSEIIRRKIKNARIKYIEVEEKNKISQALKEKAINSITIFQKELSGHVNVEHLPIVVESAKNIAKVVSNFNVVNIDLTGYLRKEQQEDSLRVAQFAVNLAIIYNNKIKQIYIEKIKSAEAAKNEEALAKLRYDLRAAIINLEELSLAAILRNVGTICQNKTHLEYLKNNSKIVAALKEKFPGITDKIFEQYDSRYLPIYSYCLLFGKVSYNTGLIILLSNEGESKNKGILQANDSYIKQYTGFNYGAKILNLCTKYDTQLKKAIKEKRPLEEAISLVLHLAENGYVNKFLTSVFFENLTLYPYGTKVRLSNGQECLVVKPRKGFPNTGRPVVKTKENIEIDLMKNDKDINSLIIKEIVENPIYQDSENFGKDLTKTHVLELEQKAKEFSGELTQAQLEEMEKRAQEAKIRSYMKKLSKK